MDRAAGGAHEARQRVAVRHAEFDARRTAVAAEFHGIPRGRAGGRDACIIGAPYSPWSLRDHELRSLLPEAVDAYVTPRGARRDAVAAAAARRNREAAEGDADRRGPGCLPRAARAALGARRALEIGTFTGYSALAVATALPADGQLVCCDISDEWTQIARRYWREAGLADRIDLRLAPAADTLRDLLRDSGPDSFDFAFVDADKTGYDGYYEACLTLVRPGGLIAFDNTLWSGSVADPAKNDADTVALRALNLKVRDDPRVTSCLVRIGDGVLLALKHERARERRVASTPPRGSARRRK